MPFRLPEMQSPVDLETSSVDELVGVTAAADKRGKHRILADLKRLEQDSKFVEEELEELERTGNVSTICEKYKPKSKRILSSVEIGSDPLLPTTNGPVNPSWD